MWLGFTVMSLLSTCRPSICILCILKQPISEQAMNNFLFEKCEKARLVASSLHPFLCLTPMRIKSILAYMYIHTFTLVHFTSPTPNRNVICTYMIMYTWVKNLMSPNTQTHTRVAYRRVAMWWCCRMLSLLCRPSYRWSPPTLADTYTTSSPSSVS